MCYLSVCQLYSVVVAVLVMHVTVQRAAVEHLCFWAIQVSVFDLAVAGGAGVNWWTVFRANVTFCLFKGIEFMG